MLDATCPPPTLPLSRMYAGSRNNGSTRSLNQLAGAPAEVARYNTQTFHLAKFPHKLSFYERPPLEEITLEEFEEWALDRLRGAARSASIRAQGES